MLNRYPLWKYLLLVFVTAVGFVYSIPNMYIPDPAIQVSGDSTAKVIDTPVLNRMEQALKQPILNTLVLKLIPRVQCFA